MPSRTARRAWPIKSPSSDKTGACRTNRSTASQGKSRHGLALSGLLRSLTFSVPAINRGFFSIDNTSRTSLMLSKFIQAGSKSASLSDQLSKLFVLANRIQILVVLQLIQKPHILHQGHAEKPQGFFSILRVGATSQGVDACQLIDIEGTLVPPQGLLGILVSQVPVR